MLLSLENTSFGYFSYFIFIPQLFACIITYFCQECIKYHKEHIAPQSYFIFSFCASVTQDISKLPVVI